jgi:hypothetical protein
MPELRKLVPAYCLIPGRASGNRSASRPDRVGAVGRVDRHSPPHSDLQTRRRSFCDRPVGPQVGRLCRTLERRWRTPRQSLTKGPCALRSDRPPRAAVCRIGLARSAGLHRGAPSKRWHMRLGLRVSDAPWSISFERLGHVQPRRLPRNVIYGLRETRRKTTV